MASKDDQHLPGGDEHADKTEGAGPAPTSEVTTDLPPGAEFEATPATPLPQAEVTANMETVHSIDTAPSPPDDPLPDDERTEIAFLSGALADLSSLADELPKVPDLGDPEEIDDPTEVIKAAKEAAVELPQAEQPHVGEGSFYPKKRKRRTARVLDPFAPADPREAEPQVKLGQINDEGIPDETPSFNEEAPQEDAPAELITSTDAPPSPDGPANETLHPPQPAAPAPQTSQGMPAWATFALSYAATVVITLSIAWFAFDLSLNSPPSLAASNGVVGTMGDAELKASQKGPALRAETAQDRCHNEGYWSRPEVLYNRFDLHLTSGKTLEKATAVGLNDCQLMIRLEGGDEKAVPLADIKSFEKR